jgi:hypothetical protein
MRRSKVGLLFFIKRGEVCPESTRWGAARVACARQINTAPSVTAGTSARDFLNMSTALNTLRVRPRWYNAITTNCTTSIRTQPPTTLVGMQFVAHVIPINFLSFRSPFFACCADFAKNRVVLV